MKPLSLALIFSLLLIRSVEAQAPKATAVPAKDECTIAGMVVKLAGSEPLRKARVWLQSIDERDRSTSAITDFGGHFELKGIRPGRYRLSVGRIGFVSQEYGQKKPDDPGANLTLQPGQEMKDLVFRLIPSAVISGRILDEDGEPLPEVSVSALRQVYSEGKRNLSTEITAATNDLGEYRLFGLAPGRYFVSAALQDWSRSLQGPTSDDSETSQEGYAKMYYPGTPDAANASSISVKAGEEIPRVEILMRRVLVYRIRGRVYNQIKNKTGSDTMVFLTSRTKSREWPWAPPAHVQKDGSFEISGVLPGSYMLTALWHDEDKRYTGRAAVDIGNADAEGVALTIAQGTDINGRVIWDGPASLEQDQLTVQTQPTDMEFGFGFRGNARVSTANTFVLKDVPSGTYRVSVWGQGKDCYIKDVQYAGSSALEDGFTVRQGSLGSLDVVISSRGARAVGGVANEDGLPAAGVRVVLVPEAARRTQYRLYQTSPTDQYGHFEMRGIAPGDYKLFSWEEVESEAWEDPEFLKPFEDKGEKVSFQEGEQKTVNLTAIRTKSPAETRP